MYVKRGAVGGRALVVSAMTKRGWFIEREPGRSSWTRKDRARGKESTKRKAAKRKEQGG